MWMSVWERLHHVDQLDRNASCYHGGCRELTKVNTSPKFDLGDKFFLSQQKDCKSHFMLLIATQRMSCSARTQTSWSGQVLWSAGFISPSLTASSKPHESKHGQSSAAEATTWMWAEVSLWTFFLCGGTCSHDGKSGTNFYLHWQTAQDYLSGDAVIVQL